MGRRVALEQLENINYHLGVALAELNNLSPACRWVGSLKYLRKLIKVKLKLESISHSIKNAERMEHDRRIQNTK